MDPIRIGILGAGNWARSVHLPNLRVIPGVVVAAVTSNDPERRRKAREAWGGSLCFYEEPADLLADDLHAVIVCTPNHTHEELSIAALQARKHVLCEKPVAFSIAGVERIAAARAHAGTMFQAGLELRYSDVIRRMLALIGAGEIGTPKMLGCLLLRDWGAFGGWRGDPALSGGMVLELGIHYLDLFNVLAGGRPARVHATGGHALGAALPDYFWCSVDYDNGARAGLGLTVLAAARNEILLHVVGTEARLEGEIISGRVSLWQRRRPEPEDRSPERPPDYRFDGFPGSLEALEHWIHCIRTGEAPFAGIAAARDATAVSAAAEASLQSGQPALVPL
jgi:myo-inositol 2-dehydrogenase / D-chiro-inositol 1-dehydrogenase